MIGVLRLPCRVLVCARKISQHKERERERSASKRADKLREAGGETISALEARFEQGQGGWLAGWLTGLLLERN